MNLVTRSQGNVQVLELHGRFDAHMAPQVKEWQDKATSPYVVVNLADVHFVDSGALAALVRGMKLCRQKGGDVHVCALQQPVQIIFELTKMNRAFGVYETEEQAIGAFES